jgi:hypothetical protein
VFDATLLGIAALAATLVPVRRAVRTDPAVALRTECVRGTEHTYHIGGERSRVAS